VKDGRRRRIMPPPAPGRPSRIALLLAGLILVTAIVGMLTTNYAFENSVRRIRGVRFPGGEIIVDVAASAGERRRGLAGRAGLAPDSGMLFVYRDTRSRRFTMEGMLFPLDIISLDETGRVLAVEGHAPGEGAFDIGPARYVIEAGGGWAAAHGVRAGLRAEFIRD
jgi:uncharacterized membrane protein (UPF0127 family)